MRKIITLFIIPILIIYIHVSTIYAALTNKITIIEDNNTKLKILIKTNHSSYNAIMLSSPIRLLINITGAEICKNIKIIKPKGFIINKIYIGRKKQGTRIVFYAANKKYGFRYRINSKGKYLIITCWPKGKEMRIRKGQYMPLPKPKKELKVFSFKNKTRKSLDFEKNKIPTYTGKKISLEFYKADLHNVFRLFSEISGKNIIVSDKVKGSLTLSLKNVPWDFALDLILEVENLKKEEKLNTYIITPIGKKEKGKGELIVKKVSAKTVHLARILKKKEEERRKAQQLILKAYELEKKGKKLKALALYEKAVNLWKENADLLKKTAYLYYEIGNFSRSYYFANKALKINSDDAEASLYAALSAIKLEKKDDAKVFFNMAIEGKPKIPEAFYDYALFLEKEKDYIHALSIYEQYEELFGPILQTSLSIAKIYYILGYKDRACRKYKEIMLSGFKMDLSTKKFIRDNIKRLCNKEERSI